MVLVDTLTGFGKAVKTKNKGTEEAIKGVRQWVAQFGCPLSLRVDSGPGFREGFVAELKKMGIIVNHSTAYSPQSNSHAERFGR